MNQFLEAKLTFAEKTRSGGDPKPPIATQFLVNKDEIILIKSSGSDTHEAMLRPEYYAEIEKHFGIYPGNSVLTKVEVIIPNNLMA